MPIAWFPRSPPADRRGLGVYVALQNTCFSRKICSHPNNRCQPGASPEGRRAAAETVLTENPEGSSGWPPEGRFTLRAGGAAPDETIRRMRAAAEAGDVEGVVELASPDVVLRSPITASFEF